MTKRVRNKVNKFEKKVKDGTYPEQGLPQVIRAIRACYKEYLEWADDLKTEKVQFSWRMNNLYCGCLYASIFAYGAQGRTKAVEELDYNEFEECWKLNKPIASTKFKTSKKYGVQIITIPEGVGKRLMKSYYEIVRPLARNYLITKQIRLPKKGIYENKILLFYLPTKLLINLFCNEIDEKLFLSKTGRHLKLSRYIKHFFLKHAKLDLTVTTLRKIVETVSKLGTLKNIITAAESIEINRTLGHSSRISNSTYVMNTTQIR
jgi:hypothetical protein